MAELNQAITAPVVLTLEDGGSYTFEPIGLNIWCEFCRWVNQAEGERITKPRPRHEMLQAAQSFDGMRWLLWRSLKTHHKDIKIDQIGNLIRVPNMDQVFLDIADLPTDEELRENPLRAEEATDQ